MLSKSPAIIIGVVWVLLLLLLLVILPFTFTNDPIFHFRSPPRSLTSLHRRAARMNNVDPFTSMLRREHEMKKEKARKRMAAARENRSQEQIDADNEANKKRMKVTRENRSQEQIDADREKDKESKAAARENRSQERTDADNEANKKRMKVTRENRTQKQK